MPDGLSPKGIAVTRRQALPILAIMEETLEGALVDLADASGHRGGVVLPSGSRGCHQQDGVSVPRA